MIKALTPATFSNGLLYNNPQLAVNRYKIVPINYTISGTEGLPTDPYYHNEKRSIYYYHHIAGL